MSFDIEMVSYNVPYSQFPTEHRYFNDESFPTHKNLRVPLARYIHLGEPYGSTAVIDCKYITAEMLKYLVGYMSRPDVIMVGFDLENDF